MMKTKQAVYLLTWVTILCMSSSGAEAGGPQVDYEMGASHAQVPVREYTAENGRSIAISQLGNLVKFESPRGFEHMAGHDAPLHGYVLSYRDPRTNALRVVHNVNRSQSSTIKPGLADFVPVSFEGPPSGEVLPRGKLVRASALVATRDGYVQIKTIYSWLEGSLRVEYQVRSTSRPVKILSFKTQSRFAIDGGGAFGLREPKSDVEAIAEPPATPGGPILGPGVIVLAGPCCRRCCQPGEFCGECPPQLPPGFEGVNNHSILHLTGPDGINPDAWKASYQTAGDPLDPCERQTVGACQQAPLPRLEQDSVVTTGWFVNKTLGKGKFFRFLTRISVF
jgi:hypothetical protein